MSSVNIQKRATCFIEEFLIKNRDFLDFLIDNGYLPGEPTVEELEEELHKQVRSLLEIKNNFEVCKRELDTALSSIYENVKNALDNLETEE